MTASAQDRVDRRETWDAAWGEREALLRVARHRSASHADAEDAVSEAITRSAEDPEVDAERIGSWLTTVTSRLCVDAARERAREPKRVAYQVRQGTTTEDHSDDVCDRAEAGWLAGHVADLPERQSRALTLRADGHDVPEIAATMGVTPKTVESLLQRARTHLRSVLASALAWIGLVCGGLFGVVRRRAAVSTTAVAAISLSAVLGGLHSPVPPAAAGPAPAEGGPSAPSAATHDARDAARAVGPRQPEPVLPVGGVAARPGTGASTTSGDEPPTDPSAVLPKNAAPLPTMPGQRIEVGPVHVEHRGTWTYGEDETFVEEVERCLEEGPVVSTTFVGCRPEPEQP